MRDFYLRDSQYRQSAAEHVHRRHNPSGFTRFDLIAISAVLSCFILLSAPAWSRALTTNRALVCLHNHRLLVNAWQLYAADYNQRLCANFTTTATEGAMSESSLFHTWANNIMSWAATGSLDEYSTTNLLLVRKGLLAPYSPDPVGMIKCPEDTFLSDVQIQHGWKARVRSVSMNTLMGYPDQFSTAVTRSWADPRYRQFLKLSEIPNPAQTWVTTDEHANSINDGHFIILQSATSWGDVPGSYHSGGCTFGFADGHAETHTWLSKTTRVPVRTGGGVPIRPFDNLGKKDFKWFMERFGWVPFQ